MKTTQNIKTTKMYSVANSKSQDLKVIPSNKEETNTIHKQIKKKSKLVKFATEHPKTTRKNLLINISKNNQKVHLSRNHKL